MNTYCCGVFVLVRMGRHMKTTKKAFVLIILAVGASAYAQPVVPREDFIAVTGNIISALDAVETVCDDPKSGKQAVDLALKKLRNVLVEYKRYDATGRAFDGVQYEIVKTLAAAERSYTIFSLSLGPCGVAPTEDAILQATEYSEQARRLFLKYKAKE